VISFLRDDRFSSVLVRVLFVLKFFKVLRSSVAKLTLGVKFLSPVGYHTYGQGDEYLLN